MSQEIDVQLDNLEAVPGARKVRTRRGRGIGSGLGKTAGRGGKGQTARSGKGRPRGFEGGQTPLHRRIPKWGFKNPFRKHFEVVNVGELDTSFSEGEVVDGKKLKEKRLIRDAKSLIKILGEGSITKKLIVNAHKFSQSAAQKINQCGGQVNEIAIAAVKPEKK